MIKKRRKYISKQIIDFRRNRTANKKGYIGIIAIVLMIIISIVFIKLGIEVEKNTKSIYQYKIEKNSNYEVVLKANDFYQTEKLPADLCYASQSIDTFAIDFVYKFKGNNRIDTMYNYNITANLVGTVKDEYEDKEVWNRSFNIAENKSDKQVEKDEFSIQEKVDIDYEEYNNLVHLYEKEYGLKLNAVLKVCLNITYQTDLSRYGINTEKIDDFIELDIPLTNTITEVNKNYENESVIDILPLIEKIRIKKNTYFVLAGIFMISALIVYIVRISKNKMTEQEKYEKNVNHILKYYRDLIVTVNNKPNFDGLKQMELTSLDDLIDVAEQNNCNIIHYEDLKNRTNCLYAIVGEYVYCYRDLGHTPK